MKERPILFTGEMVRAILDLRKTQTRRIVKLKNNDPMVGAPLSFKCSSGCGDSGTIYGFDSEDETYKSPYGQPGDHLWVREKWGKLGWSDDPSFDDWEFVHEKRDYNGKYVNIVYAEEASHHGFEWCDEWGNTENDNGRPVSCWKPSIHMPRWASRITLKVTDVRVEQSQDITIADLIAEGAWDLPEEWDESKIDVPAKVWNPAYEAWQSLWDSINAKRGFGLDAHPWVWVVEFEMIKGESK